MRIPALASVLVLAALAALPTRAQEPAPAKADSAAFMTEALALCARVAGGDLTALQDKAFPGWLPREDDGMGTPFTRATSYGKLYDGFSDVTLWATFESFPGQDLGYCRVDAADLAGVMRFEDLAGQPGLAGSVRTEGSSSYGAWRMAAGETQLFVMAQLVDDLFQLEINALPPAASTEPASAPEPAKTKE